MARNSRDMNLTPDQNKIFSNLIDMFDGFVPISTIKETVKSNNYNLDRSLAALLQVAESGNRNASPAKERKGHNQFKNQKTPTNSKSSYVSSPHSSKTSEPSYQKFNHEAEDGWKGAKKKNKPEQRSRVQMPYSSQPPRDFNAGYSDFRKNVNFYQGSPLQYRPPQQPERMPNPQQYPNPRPPQQPERMPNPQQYPNPRPPQQPERMPNPQQYPNPHRHPAPYSYFTKNPRHGPPIIQQNSIPPSAANMQMAPNNFSNAYLPSSLHSVPSQSLPTQDPKEIEMAKTYDRVYKIVNDGFKIMVLMRGCPGSGKTHAANEIIHTLFGKEEDPKKYVFSADDYFINAHGVYNFNPEHLGQAHQTTQAKVLEALKSGITPVIIDNTNTQAWEMKIYVPMAVAWGYYLEVLEPLTSWKFDPKMLTRKSVHNIPLYKVRDMLERYERDITGKKLLELHPSKYPPLLTPPQLASNSPKKKFYDSLNTKSNFVKVEKVEKAVNKNISEMMNSFFKKNPPRSVQRAEVSSNEFSGSRSTRDNQISRENSSSKSRFSSNKSLFAMVDELTTSLSQTNLNKQAKTKLVPKKIRKPRKPRERKKLHPKIPNFSKDYVLVLEDKSRVYQRDYSSIIMGNKAHETATVDNTFEDISKSGRKLHPSSSLPSVFAAENEILNTSPIKDVEPKGRPLSSLGNEGRNSVYSSTSTLTGLVAYSDSGSSESEDECAELYSESSSSDDGDPNVMIIGEAGYSGTNMEHLMKCKNRNCDVLNEEDQRHNSSDVLPGGIKAFSEAYDDADFLKTWNGSENETENRETKESFLPKPPRKQVVTSTSPIPDSEDSFVEEERASEGVEWNSETDIQTVLNSWGAKAEISAKEMVEKFLKSLNETSSQSMPSSQEIETNDNSSDIATQTDYEQVLAALQGNLSDCPIVECCSRNINEGMTPDPKFELQQRLHLDKGTMTEDCIPIIKSSNVDITDLSKVFPPEISHSILGLIDYCKGDINEVISSLIDDGYEISPEQFEILASMPKNCLSVAADAEIEIPAKKEDNKPPKVATELPKPRVKQAPTKAALKLKEELESKIKINPNSYPKFTQQLKRQREHQQQFPSISESMGNVAPDEPLVFVLDKSLVDQLQQKFGTIDLSYIKDFNPVVRIPSSLAFQLYGCILEAAEDNVSQQERLMQEMISSDQKLAQQLQDSEIDRNRNTELVDIMDMELALQLYHADLKALKASNFQETAANVLSRRLLYEMFPNIDQDTLSAMYQINNYSFHDTVQAIVEKYQGDRPQLSSDFVTHQRHLSVKPSAPEPKAEEPDEESSFTVDDYKEELSHHYQMRTKCFNQAREAYNSGKSQVASYFSQLAFLHKQKMEKASTHIIQLEVDSNSTETLDLHFFATKDALLALDIFLDNHIKTLRSQNSPSKILYLITGRGTHSSGGIPKVKPAVMKRLQRRNIVYKHVESNPGLLSVTAHKNLKLSSHFQDEL